MTNRIFIAILIMILGLLIITVPTYILPVCSPTGVTALSADGHSHSAGIKFMKCHWTGQAEIGVGILIVVLGLFMLLTKLAAVRLGISIALSCIALLAAAIPTILIGVCPSEMMQCHMGTLPALLLLSGVLFIITVINAIFLNKLSRS